MPKIVSIVFLLFSCAVFSQTTKLIHGKVSYQDIDQKNIDVINYTTRKLTQTNALGEFSLEAKVNDVLIFMSNNFADQKYKITPEDFEKSGILIKLAEKPIPLDEVEIQQVKTIKAAEVSFADIKMEKLKKEQSGLTNKEVYTGEMPYAADFVQIGKMIGKLFKSKKPKTEQSTPIPLKEYANANFNPKFFTETLKVKPGDTARFLEYCEADPKSATVTQGNDELAILEFLIIKKNEFDKLK
ncbi:hypothetical protein [Flavobacterium sp. XGLA_31]|uniref:hypothetical protein n=1 Tax=Flavobacterium sp. XGLA_31 TaxID=3447666 RepID=UPI003F3FECBF